MYKDRCRPHKFRCIIPTIFFLNLNSPAWPVTNGIKSRSTLNGFFAVAFANNCITLYRGQVNRKARIFQTGFTGSAKSYIFVITLLYNLNKIARSEVNTAKPRCCKARRRGGVMPFRRLNLVSVCYTSVMCVYFSKKLHQTKMPKQTQDKKH